MLEHSSFANDVSDTLGANDCNDRMSDGKDPEMMKTEACWKVEDYSPSSFRMYFRANDKPVSFLSTIRTLPKAPRPTTRSKRK